MKKDCVLSVVLGSYNRISFLKSTINSIRSDSKKFVIEIIVVDGGSTDGSVQWLLHQKDIITIIQHNHGKWNGEEIKRKSWGYFMNLGFKCAKGKYILMLSDDCLIVPGSIKAGLQAFDGPEIGGVAFYWRNWPEMDYYWVGTTLGEKLFINHGIYSKEALQKVGFADEDTYFFYHADGDLSLKIWQAGYKIVDCKQAIIEHFIHTSKRTRKQNNSKQQQDWQAYINKWKGVYQVSNCENNGGWITYRYYDTYRTWRLFPRWYVLRNKVLSYLVKNIKRINIQRDAS